MIRSRRTAVGSVAAALAACALLFTGATTASAATAYPPEGGTWNYGTNTIGSNTHIVYSTYYHPSRNHRTSVNPASGVLYRSPTVGPGTTAHREASTSLLSGNKSYYAVL